MTETVLEKHYRKTLELVSGYAANRRHSIYCEYIEEFIITKLKEGKAITKTKKPFTPPRYDEVYREGTKWLEKLE